MISISLDYDAMYWNVQAEFDHTTDLHGVASVIRERGHRQNRCDTLESFDGDGDPSNQGRRHANLKTYEQLRSMHPEKGYLNDDDHEDSLEQ